MLLMEGLQLEWQRWLPEIQDKEIVSIYFGGGTPALLSPSSIADIISWAKSNVKVSDDVEITLEANPENIDPLLMQEFAQAGINRASIGVQTLDNYLLKKLGRIHDAKKAIEAVFLTKEAGIANISIDLMYDLPNQSLEAWKNTLKQARELPITHLSLYNLTIEPQTVFFKYRNDIKHQLPDEQLSLEMYELAVNMLNEADLIQYEISAFARDNMYSRHNVGYWTARPFLGFGPSAFSYWQGRRFRNAANLSRYVKALQDGSSPIDFEEQLDVDAKRRELLTIELRLLAGVNLKEFQRKHGDLEASTQKTLADLQAQGLIKINGHAALTKQGILFYDTVAEELI